jgi:hypothetical protein
MLTAPALLPIVSTLPSALSLGQIIGEVTADAAVVAAQAWHEFQSGGLTAGTKMHGGDRIVRLFELWQVCAGQVDFYAVARARGTRVLRERCGEDISARTIAALIDTVLDILQQVVRTELN